MSVAIKIESAYGTTNHQQEAFVDILLDRFSEKHC